MVSAFIFAEMWGLKTISLLLALLMLIQILPVQQIGKALSQSQWTEELPHGNEMNPDDGHFAKAFLPVSAFSPSVDTKSSKALIYIHYAEQIPSNHSTDIISPPPDAA